MGKTRKPRQQSKPTAPTTSAPPPTTSGSNSQRLACMPARQQSGDVSGGVSKLSNLDTVRSNPLRAGGSASHATSDALQTIMQRGNNLTMDPTRIGRAGTRAAGHGLAAAGALASYDQATKTSTAKGTAGKQVNGVVAGAMSYALAQHPLGWLAAAEDLVTNDPKKRNLNGALGASANAVGCAVDGAGCFDRLDKKNATGQNGALMQGLSGVAERSSEYGRQEHDACTTAGWNDILCKSVGLAATTNSLLFGLKPEPKDTLKRPTADVEPLYGSGAQAARGTMRPPGPPMPGGGHRD
jgi:hypothetical protein